MSQNFPAFDNMQISDFLLITPGDQICPVADCSSDAKHPCKKNRCAWSFCKSHCSHLHYVCSVVDCGEFATFSTYKNVALCQYHYDVYYSPKCRTSSCSNKPKYSGYCTQCFDFQYSLHKNTNLPTLFGSK